MQYIDWPDHGECVFIIRISFFEGGGGGSRLSVLWSINTSCTLLCSLTGHHIFYYSIVISIEIVFYFLLKIT